MTYNFINTVPGLFDSFTEVTGLVLIAAIKFYKRCHLKLKESCQITKYYDTIMNNSQ